MAKIDLDTATLAGALVCASKETRRYYICGVHIERAADGICITSTDGHKLFHSFMPVPHASALDYFAPFTIPADSVALALRAAGRSFAIELDTVCQTLGAVRFEPVDGTFPDYRRVIPQTLGGKPASYTPAVLGAAWKALGLKPTATPYLYANGAEPGLVSESDDLGAAQSFVVIMPYRNGAQTAFEQRLKIAEKETFSADYRDLRNIADRAAAIVGPIVRPLMPAPGETMKDAA